MFRLNGTYGSPPVSLGFLAPYVKPMVSNLGLNLDGDFKLQKQINHFVMSSFFQLRQLANVKCVLLRQDIGKVMHAFILMHLDYCNALCIGISLALLYHLQIVQNAAAHLLTVAVKQNHIFPILTSLHWLPVHLRSNVKILLFFYKSLNGLAPPLICFGIMYFPILSDLLISCSCLFLRLSYSSEGFGCCSSQTVE